MISGEVQKKVGGKRPGAGRPQHVPTAEQRQWVQDLRAAGETEDHIAELLKISPTTLVKHYADELGRADAAKLEITERELRELARITFQVIGEVIAGRQSAKDGRAAILIFTAKALMGWKETQIVEHAKHDYDDLSDEELAAIAGKRARSRRAVAATQGSTAEPDSVRRVQQA